MKHHVVWMGVALIVLSALQPAFRATAQEGPTDADLKAGYCLNVLNGEDALTHFCQKSSSDPVMEKIYKDGCQDSQNKIERLKAYLAARGYLFGPLDSSPVLIAGSRGDADVKDCIQVTRQPDAERDACTKNCLKQKDIIGCYKACPIPDSCKRLWPCQDLSFLPF